MTTPALLVGYDARDLQNTWDIERRERFLLRRDVEQPLSVDSDVWASVLDISGDFQRPDWTGYVQDLWDNLWALVRVLQSSAVVISPETRFIAVELVTASCSETTLGEWRDRVCQIVPPNLDSLPRKLLGYDVADYFLLSGLTNCAPPLQSQANRWLPLLNEHHLFHASASALEFKVEVEQHVPEHAPFFVFALWLLTMPP
jgi:hypothetical protein